VNNSGRIERVLIALWRWIQSNGTYQANLRRHVRDLQQTLDSLSIAFFESMSHWTLLEVMSNQTLAANSIKKHDFFVFESFTPARGPLCTTGNRCAPPGAEKNQKNKIKN